MSYLIRRVLAKPRLILDEMCRLYGKFASNLRRVLGKTRLIFPRINGPIEIEIEIEKVLIREFPEDGLFFRVFQLQKLAVLHLRVLLLPFIILLQSKNTTLAKNCENLISAQLE